ncbi:MAG: hypothetical protein AAF627_11410 [Myxococcota bacterium]
MLAAILGCQPAVRHEDELGTSSPYKRLETLDPRMAYPLSPQKVWAQKQHMMAFLEAIEQIVAGAATQDWAAIERASELMGTQSAHRLAECRSGNYPEPGIKALATAFRCRANTIGAAARARDLSRVMGQTAHTLGSCNGCHRAFRQGVVGAPDSLQN